MTQSNGVPEKVRELVDLADLATPSAVRTAATLNLAGQIAHHGHSVEALAEATGSQPRPLKAVLDALVHVGIFAHVGAGYVNTELSEYLRRDHPLGLGAHLAEDSLFGQLDLGLVGMPFAVRTGRTAYEGAFGVGYWERITTDPQFTETMRAHAHTSPAFEAELILEDYDWSGVQSVVDVGGNTGALMVALLQRHPHLRGGLLDLGSLVDIADANFREAGLADRVAAEEADFFTPLPRGFDRYLLSGILADWGDDDAVAILRRVAAAAGPDGRVVIAEIVLPEPDVREPQGALTALMLQMTMPRPARTPDEICALAARAGLARTWSGTPGRTRFVLEFQTEGDHV